MEAKGIRLQGELGISRKAIAQGMPECSDCTCMLVCAFLCTHCTRDRGCSVHPAFPAPSIFGEGSLSKPRAQCVARMRSHICVGWVERSETHHSPVALMGIASLHPSYEPAIIASEAKQSILSLYREADCFASLAMTWIGRRMLDTPHLWGMARLWRGARSSEPAARSGFTGLGHAHVKPAFSIRIDND
jgi:hypothetical protein